MNELFLMIVLGIIGFLIGGVVGAAFFSGFFPAAWIGLAIMWGIPFCKYCLN